MMSGIASFPTLDCYFGCLAQLHNTISVETLDTPVTFIARVGESQCIVANLK